MTVPPIAAALDPADGVGRLPLLTDDRYYLADDLSEVPRPLFHGRPHGDPLPAGTLLTPRTKRYAHATLSVATARVFAGRTGGVVYQVEPVSWPLTWMRQMKHTDGELHFEHLSYAGFRILAALGPDATDAAFSTTAQTLKCDWRAATGAVWCEECRCWHQAGRHSSALLTARQVALSRLQPLPAFEYGITAATPARIVDEAMRQVREGVPPNEHLQAVRDDMERRRRAELAGHGRAGGGRRTAKKSKQRRR